MITHGVAVPDAPKNELADRGRALVALNTRLLVRLGEREPIVAHLGSASDALELTWQQVARLENDTLESFAHKRQIIRDAKTVFAEGASAFLRAAVERAGTVPLGADASIPREVPALRAAGAPSS